MKKRVELRIRLELFYKLKRVALAEGCSLSEAACARLAEVSPPSKQCSALAK